MDKDELLKLCMKHGVVEFPGEGKVNVRISLDDLAKLIDTAQEAPAGTLVVQHDRIHFGGGIALYPPAVDRAAKRLALKLFEAKESQSVSTLPTATSS